MSDNLKGIGRHFAALQCQLAASLGFVQVIDHPVGKGDESEGNWRRLLADHLPLRYQVFDKCFVVDHLGVTSDEIDLLICDRQYTTLVFQAGTRTFVPAEAVYAAFEVKQRIDLANVNYAAQKVQSVRHLERTSAPIVHAGGTISDPKQPPHILGGLLTTSSDWSPTFGGTFKGALAKHTEDQRLNLGCVVDCGGWEVDYLGGTPAIKFGEDGDQALVYFYLNLLAALQRLGTVPAMDFRMWKEFMAEKTV